MLTNNVNYDLLAYPLAGKSVAAADVRDGGQLVTDRAVAFGPDSSLVLSGDERLQSSRAYVLLRAEGGITGLPVCAAANVTLGLSPDGKSLVLRRRATGVILSVR